MPNLLIKLLRQDQTYLIISCLIFPISLKLLIGCFAIFLVMRICWFDSEQLAQLSHKLPWSIKILLAIAMIIALTIFYFESRSQFYPVSYYDYLLVLIVTLVFAVYPLQKDQLQQVCLAISFSPLIIFINNLTDFNFDLRNNWGFHNANAIGLYCSVVIPLIICQIIYLFTNLVNQSDYNVLKINKNTLLIGLIISLLLSLLILISSGSRSSLYTNLLVILILLSLNIPKILKSKKGYRFTNRRNESMILVGFSCIGIYLLLYKFILSKFTFLARFLNLQNSTNLYRTYVYKCYATLGIEKPWWGWGINKAARVCESKLRVRHGGVNHAHNFILQLFAEHGLIVTLLCLISITYWILIPLVKFIFTYKLVQDNVIILGIYLSSLSILIISLFQASFFHYPLFPLWLGLFWGIQINHKL